MHLLQAYDNYIKQIKEELQKEHDTSSKKGVKPQIKQPKVSESRKFKQRSTTDISPAQMSKRDSTGSSADESKFSNNSTFSFIVITFFLNYIKPWFETWPIFIKSNNCLPVPIILIDQKEM